MNQRLRDTMAIIDRLKIVCTKCPAFVRVLYRGAPPGICGGFQKFIHWECHGDHFLATVTHQNATIRYMNDDARDEGPIPIADYELYPMTPESIDQLHQSLESESLELGEFLDVLEGFQRRRIA